MIDFELDSLGDIKLVNNETAYPVFRMNFSVSDAYPKMKISFMTKDRTAINRGLKINFRPGSDERKPGRKMVPCVRRQKEKAQSIAIRLKTELNELQNFFDDFGSELVRLRHEDLLADINHGRIKSYVESAVADIIGAGGYDISVDRLITEEANFQVETIRITISSPDGTVMYEHRI